jgi:hypothetical protein
VEQGPQTPRERALDLIKLLVGVEANWQPTFRHCLWGIRIVVVGTILAFVITSMGDWLWTHTKLFGADLRGAEGITNEELEQHAQSLKGATMPNGQKYEDWLKSEDRREDG